MNAQNSESLFERLSMLIVMDYAQKRVTQAYVKSAKVSLFENLHEFIVGCAKLCPYPQLAQKLGLSESAVRVAVQRLRSHFRQAIREVINQSEVIFRTVGDELRYHFAVISL